MFRCKNYLRKRSPFYPHGTPQVSYTPLQVAALYGFPDGDGVSETIGVIELGGAFDQTDYHNYMTSLGLTPGSVQVIPVNGAAITSDPGGANVEVMLDVEIIAAIAPKANIRVYFADNTSAGFLAAIQQARKDGCSIISISWGGPEDSWLQSDLTAFNNEFQRCANAGLTVCVASGDNGSSDGETGNHADFPASSPWVLACGGTTLIAQNGKILQETVWNDSSGGASGGGYSQTFLRPSYQDGVNQNVNRGSPDVCGVADPATGWPVLADHQNQVVGGTSAVAPMWAGLAARMNSIFRTTLGFLNPRLYAIGESAFYDITVGNNGAYQASPGWDAATGLGSPNGQALFAALQAQVGQGSPPVQPPVPPQPPTQGPTVTPIQQINDTFATLEVLLAPFPRAVSILKMLNAIVIQEMQLLGYSTAAGHPRGIFGGGKVLGIILEILKILQGAGIGLPGPSPTGGTGHAITTKAPAARNYFISEDSTWSGRTVASRLSLGSILKMVQDYIPDAEKALVVARKILQEIQNSGLAG
ncbi:MAG: S53 family peptidase [Patescibacteria group bacterium]|nr:S53 family peptidase [Patescibacteria group bacterium]